MKTTCLESVYTRLAAACLAVLMSSTLLGSVAVGLTGEHSAALDRAEKVQA